MGAKLWTNHFVRICIANFLLFVSLYMLFPVVPIGIADRLHISTVETGTVFLYLTLGMLLVGPLEAYLVDAYKRKYVYIYSFIAMLASTMTFMFVRDLMQLQLTGLVQGVLFGMASTAAITVAIDITNSTRRSAGNITLAWFSRFGMIVGIALGMWVYQLYGFIDLLYIAIICGAIGVVFSMGIYVPFRAPIVIRLFSLDRFLLIRAWVPALNVILVAFIPGLLIASVGLFKNETSVLPVTMASFFIVTAVCFLVSRLISCIKVLKTKTLPLIILGMGCLIASVFLLSSEVSFWLPGIFFGLGLGLIIPEFLMIFVNLSEHCQRGTANTTHLLACEAGIALGIATACSVESDTMLFTARVIAVLALVVFVLVTYPYYKKKRVR